MTTLQEASAAQPRTDAPPTGSGALDVALPSNLGWSVFKNTAAQGAGRILIAVSRLVIAGLIVRSYGRFTFGQYSLIFGLLAIAELVVDFGVTEIFVREICRVPSKRQRLLRVMAAAKLIQVPAAYVVLIGLVLALRYPEEILVAALVGGVALLFHGGVLLYRTLFKASLTMEREVAAELISVIVMVPLIAIAASAGAGLSVLIACHVVSRGVFFLLAFVFGRRAYRPSISGTSRGDVTWALRTAAPIACIGLLVGVYEASDVLLLSKLGTYSQLALYSGAQRLVWPALMALASVGATLYPVVASYWPDEPARFHEACQQALNAVLVLAGCVVAGLLAGPAFFMGMIGPEMVEGVAALRVLALLCFVKGIAATLGPVLYVVHAQKHALVFIAVATVVKIGVLMALIPRYGYLGAAWGAVAVELCFAAAPTLYLLRRIGGFKVNWSVPARVVLLVAASWGGAAALVRVGAWGGERLAVMFPSPAQSLGEALGVVAEAPLAAASLACLLYVPLAFAARTVTIGQIRAMLRRNQA